jgi:hypothetical protein
MFSGATREVSPTPVSGSPMTFFLPSDVVNSQRFQRCFAFTKGNREF